MPQRIQLRRTKGWRLPPNTVVVARPTKWGNPYSIRAAAEAGYGDGRDAAVEMFRLWLWRLSLIEIERNGEPPTQDEIRAALRGKDLACWCPLTDQYGCRVPCHADVLLEIANAPEPKP